MLLFDHVNWASTTQQLNKVYAGVAKASCTSRPFPHIIVHIVFITLVNWLRLVLSVRCYTNSLINVLHIFS